LDLEGAFFIANRAGRDIGLGGLVGGAHPDGLGSVEATIKKHKQAKK
jgi:hypothetical protein